MLFTRTASGLAFSPGGLRLASRAVEILGLQDRTVQEVSQAGSGRRVLRIACLEPLRRTRRPGPDRALRRPRERPRGRAERPPGSRSSRPCWRRARWTSPSARPAAPHRTGWSRCRSSSTRSWPWPAPTTRWSGSPSAPTGPGARPGTSGRPRWTPTAWSRTCSAASGSRRRTSRSSRATRPPSRRSSAAVASRWPSGSRCPATWRRDAWWRSTAPVSARRAGGRRWRCPATARPRPPPSCSGSSPLRARPRRWSGGPGVHVGRFRPAVHVTLWSYRAPHDRVEDLGQRPQRVGRAGTRRRTAGPPPSSRPAARSPATAARGLSQTTRRARRPGLGHHRGQLGRVVAVPAVGGDHQHPAPHERCRAGTRAARAGTRRGACRRTGRRPARSPA